MAFSPTTIWTALPNGFGARNLPQLSIYVSLRLDNPASSSLADYTLGNWPSTLAALVNQQQIHLQLGDGPNALQVGLSIDTSLLSPSLWDALFPSTTFVRPFAFQDHSQRAIRSYSVGAIHDYIERVYTNVANASPSEFPDITASNDAGNLVKAISGIMVETRRLAGAAGRRERYNPPLPPNLNANTTGPHPDANIEGLMDSIAQGVSSGVPGAELYRAYRFYNRGQQEAYRSNTLPRAIAEIPPAIQAPKFDFHQVIAALGDHPALLRRLGIVLDCRMSQLLPAGANYDRVRVVIGDPAGGPPPAGTKTPWTLVDFGAFRPQPLTVSDTVEGFLQLGNPQLFGVIQSDVDGAALRTLDYGVNMAKLLSELALQKAQRCEATGIAVQAKHEPQSLPALRTTGLTVYRTARDQAIYDQLTAAASNNADPGNAVLSLDDVTRGYRVDVGYNGRWFSLCARIPSYAVGATSIAPGQDEGYVKAASGTSTAKDPPNGPAVPDLYLHEALFGWENWNLCVARPGRTLSFDRNDTDRTQTEVVRREDNPPNPDFPVQISASVPPKTLPPLRFGRKYQLRARVVDLAGNGLPLSASARNIELTATEALVYQRYEPVAPPVLVLRKPVTAGESVERLVIRSKVGSDPIPNESTIFNDSCERHVAPPKTSQSMAELHGAFDGLFPDAAAAYSVAVKEKGTWQDPGGDTELIDSTGASIDPAPLDKRGEPLPNGCYVIHSSAAPALPYLPDPMAAGAMLQFPGGLINFDYIVNGGWPDLSTFLLTLTAGTGASPDFDASDGFNVRLPKGTMLTVRYSSTIAEPNLPLFARWNAMSAAARGGAQAIGNQHWMLTPYREVVFVHAVEKPLQEPRIQKLSVSRNLGDTFVTLAGEVTHHAPSTGRIEILAAWTEMVDLLSDPKPKTQDRTGRVCERDVGYDEAPLKLPPPCETVRHELGDTKHRFIRYHALGTTRYREHFPALAQTPELMRVEGHATAPIDIPNSARPDVPNVLYVIPTFEWSLSDDKLTSTRTGRGLRIYVDRTWYSSGDGELLGVIVPSATSVPTELEKYVSHWGADPVWDSKGPATTLSPSNFVYEQADPSSAPTVKSGLSLVEVDPSRSDLHVTAVGIAPQYNEQRQLYYFDLVLDPGANYFPFVRLALARFQPHSLDDAHLSRTVRADFVQLVADRAASITYNTASVDVSVSGVMARSHAQAGTHDPGSGGLRVYVPRGFNRDGAAGRSRLVKAYVETRKNPELGDLGWELSGSAVNLLPYTLGRTPDLVYFRGSVPLPGSFGNGDEYRLVVEEYELYETDDELDDPSLPIDSRDGAAYSARLVYFDTLPLSK